MEWLTPWEGILRDSEAARSAERELEREVADGHSFYAVPVSAIASHTGSDDVLYSVNDGSGRVAIVHLTYIKTPPDRPPWPSVTFFASLEAFRSDEMLPEHLLCRE